MPHQPDAVLLVEKGMAELSVIPLDRQVCILGKSPPPTSSLMMSTFPAGTPRSPSKLGVFVSETWVARTALLSTAPVKATKTVGCVAVTGSSWPMVR